MADKSQAVIIIALQMKEMDENSNLSWVRLVANVLSVMKNVT